MKRILCSLLVATLPFGSVLADAPRAAERSRQEHQGRARRIRSGRLLAWSHASGHSLMTSLITSSLSSQMGK
jgi:hypothetical protein